MEFPEGDKFFAIHPPENGELVRVEKSPSMKGDHHLVLRAGQDLAKACEGLIEEANNRGGEDNITVVLARFQGDDLEEPATDRITIELPPLEEDKTLDDNYEADTEPH